LTKLCAATGVQPQGAYQAIRVAETARRAVEQIVSAVQSEIFVVPLNGPDGFVYLAEFITPAEESALLAKIQALPLEEARYKQFLARRRTMVFGSAYDFARSALESAPPIPGFLLPLRARVAQWAGLPAEAFYHCLVSEYRPGTALGWHRDVPDYEVVAGVSLADAARMRLRPFQPGGRNRKEDIVMMPLQPRSAYLLRDRARWDWQHSISATNALRYSITFRTARKNANAGSHRMV
jgi:alkylated DNA repair dioxygenase AlkB